MFARILGGAPFSPAKLVQQRLRDLAFAPIEPAFQQLREHGGVARGVGRRGGAFNASR